MFCIKCGKTYDPYRLSFCGCDLRNNEVTLLWPLVETEFALLGRNFSLINKIRDNHYGFYRFADGDYRGEFKDGQRSGRGVLYNQHGGKIFEGQWLKDKKDGYGEEYDGNGNCTFKGYFSNGLKYGRGWELINGKFVQTWWKNGIKDYSLGTNNSNKTSKVQNQELINNEFFSYSKLRDFINSNNPFPYLFVKDKFINPAQINLCVYTSDDGVYIGELVNNKPHGNGIQFYKGRQIIYAGNWKNGLLDGIGQILNDNFKLEFCGYFTNGLRNGPGLLFDGNCNIIETVWSNGQRVDK